MVQDPKHNKKHIVAEIKEQETKGWLRNSLKKVFVYTTTQHAKPLY